MRKMYQIHISFLGLHAARHILPQRGKKTWHVKRKLLTISFYFGSSCKDLGSFFLMLLPLAGVHNIRRMCYQKSSFC